MMLETLLEHLKKQKVPLFYIRKLLLIMFFTLFSAKNLRKYVEAYMNRKDVSEKLSQVKTLGKRDI